MSEFKDDIKKLWAKEMRRSAKTADEMHHRMAIVISSMGTLIGYTIGAMVIDTKKIDELTNALHDYILAAAGEGNQVLREIMGENDGE